MMAVSEKQLETWSHQGSITQSSTTYQAVRQVLEAGGSAYSGRDTTISLQGSYGNDTNIFADSDVDVVIELTSTFYTDLSQLSADDRGTYDAQRTPATYSWQEFKTGVLNQLSAQYGGDVTVGRKAISIAANGGRRSVDVVPAAEFRKYLSFESATRHRYVSGICFWTPDGTLIVNYPRLHSDNCTAKHQATAGWFKPTVRIFKNMRNAMIVEGRLKDGDAPSYFIEGLLWNVPDHLFGGSYLNTVVACLNWILQCDRTALLCANEQYVLCYPDSPVTWTAEALDRFLNAAVDYWNDV